MGQLISIPEFDDLPDAAQQRYKDQISHNGRITNMKKVLLHSVVSFDALMTWYPLFEGIKEFISERSALFYAYAISNENDCLICNTFFVKILKDLEINFDDFAFDDDEDLLIRYGRALVSNPHEIDEQIYTQLKARFNEQQIVLLTSFASIMIATNLINTALKVPLDEYLFAYNHSAKTASLK